MSATQTQSEKTPADIETASTQTSPPRKRRRRAPATGAADDCFACQERQTKCDRRRPYCTPCLGLGKDCSGYKTALTWGVGVASRGKLRGLSLPITNSKRAAPADDGEPDKRESPPRKLTKLGPTRKESDTKSPNQIERKSTSADANTTISTPTNYGFVNMDPTSASSATTSPSFTASNCGWRRPTSLSHSRNIRLVDKKPRRHTLQPLHVSAAHPARDYGVMPMTASVVGGYGHHDFGLSSQISPMVPNFSGYDISSPVTKDFMPPTSASYDHSLFNSDHLPWASAHMAPSVSSDHGSQQGTDDVRGYFTGIDGTLDMQHDVFSRTASITSAPSDATFAIDPKYHGLGTDLSTLIADDVGNHSLTIPPSVPSLRIGTTPNMQFLIDYYDQVISPVIVAFDGPTNPFRAHILHLAVQSETLQHSLAALAASNLRMRRSQNRISTGRISQDHSDSSHEMSVRRSSMAHSLMGGSLESLPESPAYEPSSEELYHKAQAIIGLNSQLAEPTRRKDDSILASLLILCLYHICDTGVAKFKTQFAGVKRILALRGNTKGSNSKATNWLTIMFTWFDAMAATVNDRESQLSEDDIDTDTYDNNNNNEWGLENLAGCDSRLFKTISKLGRLNLLSQNKPVSPPPSRNSPTPMGPSTKDYYSIHNSSSTWSDLRSTANNAPQPSPTPTSTPSETFRKEWTAIRHALTTWTFIPTPSSNQNFSSSDRQDLLHISESFRYSALLYTERLASPALPSSHPSFQNLVQEALHHIEEVKSDVFLLWPLFITGTECVDPRQREVVRERCWGLQRDSGFFNNLSVLQLLEGFWRDGGSPEREVGAGGSGDQAQQGQVSMRQGALTGLRGGELNGGGFRWRKAMERVDGEYIVV